MKKNYFNIIFFVLIIFACLVFSGKGISVIKQLIDNRSKNITVVIDAGHGGFDPGKLGINKALEKDINLSIAFKLKHLLEENDIHVIMTREDKNGLYQQTDVNKKLIDMRNRVRIVNTSDAVLAVSIHQNSYPQESIWGAQVFYYQNSEEGKILAETIQETIKKTMNDGNHRLAKSNGTYYMLRKSTCTLVIVECGFLSNRREANLLCEDAYQEKMAWSIHLGIMEYINNYVKDNTSPLAERN